MYTNKNVLYVVSKLSFPNFVNENNFYNFEYSNYSFSITTIIELYMYKYSFAAIIGIRSINIKSLEQNP